MRLDYTLGLALSLVMFGCGGDDDDVTPDASPQPDAAAADAAPLVCVDPPSGAIAWWDGEIAGDDILDGFPSSGNTGNPMTTTGYIGDAVQFNETQFLVVNRRRSPSRPGSTSTASSIPTAASTAAGSTPASR